MKYYNTVLKNEVPASRLPRNSDGGIALGSDIIEVEDDSPFFSPIPVGKQLAYGENDIPNGLEDVPAAGAAVILAEKLDAYYHECYAFQLDNIDANLLDEMSKSESLVEAGRALEADLPLANGDGDWLESLWTFYYTEKAKLQDGQAYSRDFAGAVGNVPNDHASVRAERKTFLAGKLK